MTLEQATTKAAAPAAKPSESAARPQTPPAQEKQDEKFSTETPTASSSVQRSRAGTASSATPVKAANRTTAPPAVPALPKGMPKTSSSEKTTTSDAGDGSPVAKAQVEKQDSNASVADAEGEQKEESKPVARAPPTSWANLFAKKAAATSVVDSNGTSSENTTVNGNGAQPTSQLFPKSNATNVAEAIRAYQVGSSDKISFIEPRGLINTGNMCYMNSVCVIPDSLSKNATL